jgi:hypothetical protein
MDERSICKASKPEKKDKYQIFLSHVESKIRKRRDANRSRTIKE